MRGFALVLIGCVMALSGCSATKTVHQPAWVVNPSAPGYACGVGNCRPHLNGYSAQRTAAIRRALDEIAMQKGVTINNVALVGTKGDRNGTSTSLESWSFQTVDNQKVTAFVKASWVDPATKEMFVWMVSK